MSNFIVLIGDLEASQKLGKKEREYAQIRLNKILEKLNNSDKAIQSRYTITLGDEFQAVYKRADQLLRHSWKIMAEMHPVKVRFSIGLGTISTPIIEERSIGMDGPAFYKAREGINELKEHNYLYCLKTESSFSESAVGELINGSLQLLSDLMRGWNQHRFRILHLLDEGEAIKKIANQLDISNSAVYKNRRDGSLEVILHIKNSITKLINDHL